MSDTKELVSLGFQAGEPEPKPDDIFSRGACPKCGHVLISNLYWVEGKGYLFLWECWNALQPVTTCDYRRTL